HILLPTHELVLVEEMWAESLFLGDMPERVLETGKIWETLDGFDMSKATHNGTVRPVLRRHEARSLMHRLPDCIDQVAAQQAPNEVFYAAA
ncbi:Hint domain-containing protein, partial [Ascidiaceihabitans sp.]|nr:Hint domain-containing protein [Ascidiaceihabitans sp.]